MCVIFFAPAHHIQRVLKFQKCLHLRRCEFMLHLQVIMELRQVLQFINGADIFRVQHIRMDFQAIIQPF